MPNTKSTKRLLIIFLLAFCLFQPLKAEASFSSVYNNYIIDPLADIFINIFNLSDTTPVQVSTKTSTPQSTSITTTLPPNSDLQIRYTTGPQGPKGDKGDTGPQGPRGERGPAGSSVNIDTSNFVDSVFFNKQVGGILDSIDNGISGLSESLSAEVSTALLNVSGLSTLSGGAVIGSSITGTDKALVVNNNTSTGNIAEFQDGGTAVVTIADGGKIGIGATSPTNDLSFGNSAARKIWVEQSSATTAGKNLTIASGSTGGENDFVALNQTGRLWYAMTAAPNGNIYGAVTYGSDRGIYMQTAGTGDFVSLNQGSKAWYGIAAAPNGDVYASESGVDIYKQTGGTGNFVALNQTPRNYGGMAVAPNGDVYVTVLNGDIYKQTGGTGNFVALGLSQSPQVWYGIAVAPNGDVYASVFGGDIYKQTGGTGNFVALNQGPKNWYSMTADPNGNIYAASYTTGQNIYKQTGGTGNFVSMNQTPRTWVGLAAAPNGNIYASVEGGDIYMQTYSTATGTADLNAGNLILSAGQAKGLGASTISFLTSTPVASGTMLQTLSEKMTILGSGNVGIGTTTPSAKLAITQTATDTGALKGIVYTGAVNTNQTASTEIPSLTLTTAGREWAAGAISTQREVLITQPTYSFVGASTITNAATVGIAGAPIKSTNATITNTHALLIQAGAVSTATNSYGLTVNAQTGATNNYAAQFLGGNVGIGTAAPTSKLHVLGTVCLDIDSNGACTDNTSALSDSRLKDKVEDINNGLELVRQFRPVTFTWNGLNNTGTANSLGFIAQDMEALFPNTNLVITDTAGYKNLDYSKLTAVLASAIQELDLNLEGISGHVTPESEPFVTAFFGNIFNKISTWFADASNGITDMFAVTYHAKEEICINETCVNEDQLKALLQNAGVNNPSPAPELILEPTPDPVPADPTCSDGIQNQDETGVDTGGVCTPAPAPDPVPEPAPEPTPEPAP